MTDITDVTREPFATNFDRVAAWLSACGKTPSPEALSLQIGVHLEEMCELLRALSFSTDLHLAGVHDAAAELEAVANDLKKGIGFATVDWGRRTEFLDAICDCDVTGNGLAYLAGFDKNGADREVLRSNDSKLVDGKPVLLPGGKIGKGPQYSPPDLRPYV